MVIRSAALTFVLVLMAPERSSTMQVATAPTAVDRTLAETDCSNRIVGDSVPIASIKEPVSGVTLAAPRWSAAAGASPAYCAVDGVMTPIDRQSNAKPINFRVLLPAAWSGRAVQIGGGGMNGTIPNLTGGPDGSMLQRGFAVYGSDSGHQSGPGLAAGASDWSTNDEAIRNLGYLQLKKTHDAAMVIIERAYHQKVRVNYFVGTSQGGREALTVAQRYPADYDGVAANVPIVNFSSLMLAPELIRIQEKPLANWVTRAKVNAIRGEFMRQCDGLDGLLDGVINNYMACRARFDSSEGPPDRNPWEAKRCPGNVDPNPADTSAAACLTEGQIATLKLVYSRYRFATPLANDVRTFGMWVPNTDPSGSGLIVDTRFKGQEGAAENAPMHAHLGALGVTGFLMRNPQTNPLDYVEGGPLDGRRHELSEWLDSTNPDLSRFAARGGKLIVAIGTDDTLASPGAQLDYYQSVIDKMGRATVDSFARFFVIPQVGHGLRGNSYSVDGSGKTIPVNPIPSTFDRVQLLVDWVEHGSVPGTSIIATAGDRTLPVCSYPAFPKYISGPSASAQSYQCEPILSHFFS
jgi:tannase/feruloyl esterase